MGYDLHIVRTKDWLDAEQNPIGKDEVVKLIAIDNELQCVEADFQETINSKTGDVIRVKTPGYLYIKWNGVVRFWWNTREIVCKNPERNELMKLVRIASALNAHAVGDEGEVYEIGRTFFGKEKLGYTDALGTFRESE